jgi:hypothetical protein
MNRCPRVGAIRILQPVGLIDLCDNRVNRWTGRMVRVVQPYGCPRNGTMGFCYAEDVKTKAFIGLVLCTSLQPLKRKTNG